MPSSRTDERSETTAQERARGCYERGGYRAAGGGRYLDAGIWHRDMARTLPGGVGAP